ncbi:radical SAM protein [bacterium]|nr:radical SAM protein [bacterium]
MLTSSKSRSIKELQRLSADYPDIPMEAIIKQDILRIGIDFSEDSCRIASGYKPKDYFIFSFDLVTLDELEKEGAQFLNAPEEVRFSGGEWDLKPTIFNVRLNPISPYRVEIFEGKLRLTCDEEFLADAEFHPVPKFYDSTLSSGKSISQISPVLEWGYLVYLTVFRLCQYWGRDEECQFCDINENYRQQRKAGREYTGIKRLEDILEALSFIYEKDDVSKAITITGGSITSRLKDMDEVEFYLQYARAIRQKFKDRWIIKTVVEAFEKKDCLRLRDEGSVDIYHPNYEIWDQRLFATLCPGKERYVGWEEWMKRIVDSADVFGPENVIPNFVAGVEMSQPDGYSDFNDAVESTRQGLEFFMSRSIMPRFTTWCREPLAHLGQQNPPPLEYYVKLLRVWRDTMEKYQLPTPPGYGEPGLGKAVFSVSAFMDVLR